MKTLIRTALSLVLVTSILFSMSCGGVLTGLRAGLAASTPIIDSLVSAGAITQDTAAVYVGDVNEGVNDAIAAENQIKQIPASDTKAQQSVEKATIYFNLAQQLRVILSRHIGGATNPTLTKIAGIFQGVIGALETYYGQVVTVPEAAARGEVSAKAARADVDPEKQLEAAMKSAKAQMKALQ